MKSAYDVCSIKEDHWKGTWWKEEEFWILCLRDQKRTANDGSVRYVEGAWGTSLGEKAKGRGPEIWIRQHPISKVFNTPTYREVLIFFVSFSVSRTFWLLEWLYLYSLFYRDRKNRSRGSLRPLLSARSVQENSISLVVNTFLCKCTISQWIKIMLNCSWFWMSTSCVLVHALSISRWYAAKSTANGKNRLRLWTKTLC